MKRIAAFTTLLSLNAWAGACSPPYFGPNSPEVSAAQRLNAGLVRLSGEPFWGVLGIKAASTAPGQAGQGQKNSAVLFSWFPLGTQVQKVCQTSTPALRVSCAEFRDSPAEVARLLSIVNSRKAVVRQGNNHFLFPSRQSGLTIMVQPVQGGSVVVYIDRETAFETLENRVFQSVEHAAAVKKQFGQPSCAQFGIHSDARLTFSKCEFQALDANVRETYRNTRTGRIKQVDTVYYPHLEVQVSRAADPTVSTDVTYVNGLTSCGPYVNWKTPSLLQNGVKFEDLHEYEFVGFKVLKDRRR